MKFISIIASLCWSLNIVAQAPLEGKWRTGIDSLMIEIYPSSDHWEGKVASTDHPKAAYGKIVLRNLVQVDSHWEGEFYIPPLGSWLDATLTPNDQQMEVTAHAWFISKTKTWTKAEGTIPKTE